MNKNAKLFIPGIFVDNSIQFACVPCVLYFKCRRYTFLGLDKPVYRRHKNDLRNKKKAENGNGKQKQASPYPETNTMEKQTEP